MFRPLIACVTVPAAVPGDRGPSASATQRSPTLLGPVDDAFCPYAGNVNARGRLIYVEKLVGVKQREANMSQRLFVVQAVPLVGSHQGSRIGQFLDIRRTA